jgi:hypothetical protein
MCNYNVDSIRHNEIFCNDFPMVSDYFIIDKTYPILIILLISLIKSRLDISLPSATKKKPWCESTRLFCFQSDARLRGGGMETKKPLPCGTHGWLFLWAVTLRGSSRTE